MRNIWSRQEIDGFNQIQGLPNPAGTILSVKEWGGGFNCKRTLQLKSPAYV